MSTKKVITLKGEEQKMREALRQRHLQFLVYGRALRNIHDLALYKLAGFSNFSKYCAETWNMCSSRAYQWMRAATVFNHLKAKYAPGLTDDRAIGTGRVPGVEGQLLHLAPALAASRAQQPMTPVLDVWRAVQTRVRQGDKLTTGLIDEEWMNWRKRNQKLPKNRNRRLYYLNATLPIFESAKLEKDKQIIVFAKRLESARKALCA